MVQPAKPIPRMATGKQKIVALSLNANNEAKAATATARIIATFSGNWLTIYLFELKGIWISHA
ncbi:MAG: hypothetical protein H0V82_00105 [Candidatus Protochlamydia sp.]|nr:hypothetical protein [Candidatus Protochlamydia sp.]